MVEYKKFEDMQASRMKMTVGVSAEHTGKTYNKVINDYCRKSSLPGFRPGKVPRQVVIRKFADGLIYESATQVVNESIKEALEKTDKPPISSPQLDKLPEFKPGEAFEFSVTYDVFPEIELGEYKGLKIEEKIVNIQNEDQQKELERLAESQAIYLNQDSGTVNSESIVTLEYVELDENGSVLEHTRRKNFVLNMSHTHSPFGIEEQITGMKIGETRRVERLQIKTASENLKADDADGYSENAAGDHPKMDVTVQEIKERRVPELDDEFAQDISEDLKTLQDLKNKIADEMKRNASEKIRQLKIQDINAKLLELCSLEPPQSMVEQDVNKAWKNYLQRAGIAENKVPDSLKNEMMPQLQESAVQSIKTRLVLGKIVEKENISVSEEEILSELKQNAEKYGTDVEELEKRFGKEEYRGYLKSKMVEKKLFDFLVESAQISLGEEIDYFELLNL